MKKALYSMSQVPAPVIEPIFTSYKVDYSPNWATSNFRPFWAIVSKGKSMYQIEVRYTSNHSKFILADTWEKLEEAWHQTYNFSFPEKENGVEIKR